MPRDEWKNRRPVFIKPTLKVDYAVAREMEYRERYGYIHLQPNGKPDWSVDLFGNPFASARCRDLYWQRFRSNCKQRREAREARERRYEAFEEQIRAYNERNPWRGVQASPDDAVGSSERSECPPPPTESIEAPETTKAECAGVALELQLDLFPNHKNDPGGTFAGSCQGHEVSMNDIRSYQPPTL